MTLNKPTLTPFLLVMLSSFSCSPIEVRTLAKSCISKLTKEQLHVVNQTHLHNIADDQEGLKKL